MTRLEILTNPTTTELVWEAVQEPDTYLPVGQRLTLEALDTLDDGDTEGDTKGFDMQGLLLELSDGEMCLEDETTQSAAELRGYALELYADRFVQWCGHKTFVVVPKDALEFEFSYDATFFKKGQRDPSRIEIYVTATYKDPEA